MAGNEQTDTQSVDVDALKSGLKLRAERPVVLVVAGVPPPPDPRFRNTKPRILRVEDDEVHVTNAQGREVAKAKTETFSKKSFPVPLSPGSEKMGPWVKKSMPFIEDCVGTPATQLCPAAKANYSDATP